MFLTYSSISTNLYCTDIDKRIIFLLTFAIHAFVAQVVEHLIVATMPPRCAQFEH